MKAVEKCMAVSSLCAAHSRTMNKKSAGGIAQPFGFVSSRLHYEKAAPRLDECIRRTFRPTQLGIKVARTKITAFATYF